MDFKTDTRVSKKNQPKCLGTVIDVREESGMKKSDKEDLIIKVHWDNGTTSYLTSGRLAVIK